MIYGYRFIFLFSNSFRASSLPYAKAMPTERRSSSLLERFAEVQLALCKDMKNILS